MPPKGVNHLESVIEEMEKRISHKWEERLKKIMEKIKAKDNKRDSEE